MKIITVAELIETLISLDQDRCILIGDDDKYGRNDLTIGTVVRKQYGFDEGNDYHYVITGDQYKEGCIKY